MLSPSTDKLKTGLTAFEASNAAKMGLLNYAGGAKAVPGWYMTGMTRVGQVGAGANVVLSRIQYRNGEISTTKHTYDVAWSALGASPHPHAQIIYWSGVAGQYYGPSTWGWEIFGPESYYGRFRSWIHR